MREYVASTLFRRTVAICALLLAYIWVGRKIENYIDMEVNLPINDVSLYAAALSLLMVLRTNSSYDRWWEGRKLWGALVNNCRNLALKVNAMGEASPEELERAEKLIISFPKALKDHLREGPTADTLASLPEPCPEGVTHLPAYIAGQMFQLMRKWREEDKLHKFDHHLIDQHVVSFMDICGACERIRNTPLPLAHRALIPQLLGLYLLVVPLGLEFNLINASLSLGVSYFLIALELAAEDIEEPFGHDCSDLPLDQISKNIGRSVNEIFSLREAQPRS